ncbi:MAG TPA: argininosuccinate lyase [Kofleriaceae bacterium]|nr:argininosuccinate lyase [Kofleriaceae bacterium]
MSTDGGARSRRFGKGMSPDARSMNASVDFDWRLLEHDVAGSIAHARMLAAQGIIPAADAEAIVIGLLAVKEDLEEGRVAFDPELEDVHMNVEARLIERIGDPGRRLHTGRSRNDQVATDLRLYARAAAVDLVGLIDRLRLALCARAEEHLDAFMPGYTHLQRAQPVRVAHHLMAYEAMLARDRARVHDAGARAAESPLGSGALAATTLPIDRVAVAASLGFAGVTHNSLDAVGDRDFAVELVSAAALCQVHLSRLAEELVLWSSQEFGFVRLSESYCSGSSLMPHKVNPDLAELVRGKTGRVVGDWVSLITTLKALPLSYNKDLQETQEPLYDAVDTVAACLGVTTGMVLTMEIDREAMARAVARGHLLATEVVDYLVGKGLPFRQAHDVVGGLVRRAEEHRVELDALPPDEIRAESALLDPDDEGFRALFEVARAVDRRDVPGGPARARVAGEIARVRAELTGAPRAENPADSDEAKP